VVSYIGVSWIETLKYCNRNRDIMICDIPKRLREQCGGHKGKSVDRWHNISRFHSEKFQNHYLRIRDTTKSEVSIR
jgi:hypothetical protein